MRWRAREPLWWLVRARYTKAAMIAVFVLGAAISTVAAHAVVDIRTTQQQLVLERASGVVASRIEQQVADAVRALESVRPLWHVDDDPTRERFAAFLARGVVQPQGRATAPRTPTSVGFIRVLRPGQSQAFLRERRAQLPGRYGDMLDDGGTHYVLDYSTARTVLGTDLRRLPRRRRVLERARDTGRAAATEWTYRLADLARPVERRRKVSLVYLPVYDDGVVPTSIDERRERIVGWLSTPIWSDTLLERAVDGLPVHATLYDHAEPGRRRVAVAQRGGPGAGGPVRTTTIDVGGRHWSVDVETSSTGPATSLLSPWAVLLAGLVVTTLLTAYLWLLGRFNARAEQRATTATRWMEISHRSLRVLAEHVPVGILDLAGDGTVQWINSQLRDLVGVDATELKGEADWARFIHPDDRQHLVAAFRRGLERGEPLQERARICAADGSERWVAIRSAPITDHHGHQVRIVASVTDISAQVELERQLERGRDAALEASRLKSEFLANMSHEIRTPLNGVLGMASLLLDGDLTPDQRARVLTLRTAADQLLALLNDILDLSKIEAGRLRLETTAFDLRHVLRQVIRLHASDAADKGLELTLDVHGDLPATVVGDPLRIRQVLENLIGNAIKFTAEGAVRLDAHAHRVADDRVALELEVSDTGIGIAADVQPVIFRPFTQADTSTTRRFGGTGLGLSICAQLADLMDGRLAVDSRPGEGSRFTFAVELPVERWADGDDDAAAPGRTPADSGVAPQALSGWDVEPRLLLVEDNLINQQVVQGLLEHLGYTVDIAADGVEAVEAVGRQQYDMVLMDCQMPRMDGYEATRRIRASETDGSRVPIIALTAAAMPGDRERALAAGMDDHVTKPVTSAALQEALRRHLGAPLRRNPSGGTPPAAEPDPEQPVVLDWAAVHELSSIEGLLERATERFATQVPQDLAGMQRALDAGDVSAAARVAHKVKGASATVGAARLSAQLARIEAACEHSDGPSDDLLAPVGRLFDQAVEALRAAATVPDRPLRSRTSATPPRTG